MKAYLANGVYLGTQSEARKTKAPFVPVEIPTDKDGLLEFVNGLASKAEEAAAPVETMDTPPFLPPTDEAKPRRKPVDPDTASADQIVDWLLDRASVAQVEGVFAAIGARWAEARR